MEHFGWKKIALFHYPMGPYPMVGKNVNFSLRIYAIEVLYFCKLISDHSNPPFSMNNMTIITVSCSKSYMSVISRIQAPKMLLIKIIILIRQIILFLHIQ